MKRIFTIALAISLTLTLFTATAFAKEDKLIENYVTYTLKNGVLKLSVNASGEGKENAIAARAFKDRTDITKIVIGDDITEIKENAFSGCVNVKSITFSSSVKTIGSKAFSGITSLNSIIFNGDRPQIASDAFQGSQPEESGAVYTPEWAKSDMSLPGLDETKYNWMNEYVPGSFISNGNIWIIIGVAAIAIVAAFAIIKKKKTA